MRDGFILKTALLAAVLSGGWGADDVRAQIGIDGMRLLGRNDSEFAHMMDFHMVGDIAYASVGLGSGLQAYDVSNPMSPTRVASTGLPAWRAYATGDTLFSFCHASGVQMYDISAPSPSLMGAHNPVDALISYEEGVRVGDVLYVAAHQDGMHLLDLASVSAPDWIASFQLENNACWSVVHHDGYLFIANGRFGLSVVDLDGLDEVATLDLPGLASDIELSDDGANAFIALASEGVASVYIGNPLAPSLNAIAPTLGNAFTMGRVGNHLAVGSYPFAERYDVSDPLNPVRAGWDATKVYAMGADAGVTSGGDTVMVIADWRGMGVYAPEDDPQGDIEVFPTRLDFGNVVTTKDTTMVVRNTGAGDLEVTSTQTPSGISVTPESFTLDPGEQQLVTVEASGGSATFSTIDFISDDPDEPISRTQVYKNNAGFYNVGAPGFNFNLFGTDDQYHTLADQLGKVVFLEFGASW